MTALIIVLPLIFSGYVSLSAGLFFLAARWPNAYDHQSCRYEISRSHRKYLELWERVGKEAVYDQFLHPLERFRLCRINLQLAKNQHRRQIGGYCRNWGNYTFSIIHRSRNFWKNPFYDVKRNYVFYSLSYYNGYSTRLKMTHIIV